MFLVFVTEFFLIHLKHKTFNNFVTCKSKKKKLKKDQIAELLYRETGMVNTRLRTQEKSFIMLTKPVYLTKIDEKFVYLWGFCKYT